MVDVDKLLSVASVREIRESNENWHHGLSVPQAVKLTRHLRECSGDEGLAEFRLGVIHSYTSDLLEPWLRLHALVQGLQLESYHAPYGLNLLEANAGSGLVDFAPDMTLFMLTREDLHPDLLLPISGLTEQERDALIVAVSERLVGILKQFRAHVRGQFVLSILPSIKARSLGIFDRQADSSESFWWSSLMATLARRMREQLPSTHLMDMESMLAELGRSQFFDLRYWYSSRFPFSPLSANEYSRQIANLGRLLKAPKLKVIVVDADNTLWGGILGEDGFDGINLGPDYPGNAYVDFQRRLLDFQQRGFILAMCSKNNPGDVQEVLDKHPHQVLREQHFAARRVNWQPKTQNLRELAEELNLGLSSFVFVDDSDHECALVRRELPEVEVVQAPAKPVRLPACLDALARLEVLSLTQEDIAKTEMYAQDRQRRRQQSEVVDAGGGVEEYLRSLGMHMTVRLNDYRQAARLAQLSEKTNQFNLTTRRYSEQQIQDFIASDEWVVAAFSLADCFGDSGIVGMMLVDLSETVRARIDTLLMSCRVIGRQAESAFLEAVLRHLSQAGFSEVLAQYLPTKKNQLAKDFYQQHRFSAGSADFLLRDLREQPPAAETDFPIKVAFHVSDARI